MAKELHTTIKIDGEEYNVNANHAKQADLATNANDATNADQVKNLLKFQRIPLGRKDDNEPPEDYKSFNGSAETVLDIVPAKGGRFTGRVTMPSPSDTALKKDKETLLNIDTFYRLLTNVTDPGIFYTWDDEKEEANPSLENLGDKRTAINCISIVIGNENTVQKFASWNYSRKHNEDERGYYVPAYLYIEERIRASNGAQIKDNVVYFGTADSETAITLAINSAALVEVANTAYKVANRLTINLGDGTTYTFDGSDAKNIDIDSSSIGAAKLIATNSTAKPSMDKTTAQVGTANTAARSDHVHPTDTSRAASSHNHAASDINSGTLDEAYGGTGATSLSNVVVGKANKIKANYYSSTSASAVDKSSTITISPNAPSGGAEGDIWIKYKI